MKNIYMRIEKKDEHEKDLHEKDEHKKNLHEKKDEHEKTRREINIRKISSIYEPLTIHGRNFKSKIEKLMLDMRIWEERRTWKKSTWEYEKKYEHEEEVSQSMNHVWFIKKYSNKR